MGIVWLGQDRPRRRGKASMWASLGGGTACLGQVEHLGYVLPWCNWTGD